MAITGSGTVRQEKMGRVRDERRKKLMYLLHENVGFSGAGYLFVSSVHLLH
jgi:hypothetical protein